MTRDDNSESVRRAFECFGFLLSLIVFCTSMLYMPLGSVIVIMSSWIMTRRWQMIPKYGAAVLFTLSSIFISSDSVITVFIRILCVILEACSIIACIIFPLFQLRKPSGEYYVGTRFCCWTNTINDRKLSVQIWYPSSRKPETKATHFWWPNTKLIAPSLCKIFGFPTFVLDHLQLCGSNSYLELEPVNQLLPMIISSHGFYGFKGDRSSYCECFASNGYIVLAVDHIGDSAMCVYPDGSSYPFSAYLKPGDNEWAIRNAGIDERLTDIDFVMSQVVSLRARRVENSLEKVLQDCMNLEQVGFFSHSYGGATCIKYLQTRAETLPAETPLSPLSYRRNKPVEKPVKKGLKGLDSNRIIKAGIALDPWLFPLDPVSEQGSPVPLMCISSDLWEAAITGTERRKNIICNSKAPSFSYIIKGSKHHNFDDLPFLTWSVIARYFGMIGPVNPQHCFEMTSEYCLHFYDLYVRRIKSSEHFPDFGPDIYLEAEFSTNTNN